ncbi:MAG TPA: PEP-CTERM sorting domain-containing protein [Tepidisphaeraceae bacterium]|nr:PEP-CTERM sorting domain-containing protein [Tepidisphaeraceae bacterium]
MLTTSAQAGLIIPGPYSSFGSAGNATATVISAPPNFDITSAAKSFTSVGPLDFQFVVTPSGGVTTYFVTEGVTNNTGVTWTDYHEQLGTGVDGNFVLGSPVEFVVPPDLTYTNPSFPTRSVTTSDIDYTGGDVLPGQAISLTLSIVVPDIPTGGTYDFTLRQFPTVPEPATLGLIAVGSIGLLARRRRH